MKDYCDGAVDLCASPICPFQENVEAVGCPQQTTPQGVASHDKTSPQPVYTLKFNASHTQHSPFQLF